MSRVLALLVLLAVGCADAVVGGECRDGFEASGTRCVATSVFDDAGAEPDAAEHLADGGAPADGGEPLADGALYYDDGSQPYPDGSQDAGAGDAGGGGGGGDGGAPACDVGELECAGACVRPDRDPTSCGGCGIACGSGEVCAEGACEPVCGAPLSMCGALCVDLATDPDHCGLCGNVCPSGLCADGECLGPTAGHVVVVGHDYRDSRRGMNRVAGNAVLLAPAAPVRVLAYEGGASAASVRGIDRAIEQVASTTGRTWMKSATGAHELPLRLANADVLVIYPQPEAGDAELAALGTAWHVALGTFLDRGGVVVLFDGQGTNGGTWQILAAAGLFSGTARHDVSGDSVRVVAPGDAVALSVPLVYRGELSSVRFETTEPGVVVAHDDGAVVVHRVVTP